ncbi:MAG TPA: hypothetical protein VJ547_11865 [Candidatus Thermoplasmatota archaeon]|nr:hypothetical protein [Candidatus Thermoplasmatota archaeon]
MIGDVGFARGRWRVYRHTGRQRDRADDRRSYRLIIETPSSDEARDRLFRVMRRARRVAVLLVAPDGRVLAGGYLGCLVASWPMASTRRRR